MRTGPMAAGLTVLAVATGAACGGDPQAAQRPPPTASAIGDQAPRFTSPTNITNPYLPISKTQRVEFRGTNDGAKVRAVKTRLDRTQPFTIGRQRVEAAIVEDRGFQDGELHEIALDFYAQADDGTVYYLGEDVNYYKKGKVIGHEGAFRYGRDTEVLGVAMPAEPKPGAEFKFENVPKVGSEQNRVAKLGGEASIEGTNYTEVLAVEGLVLPDREKEVKYFARGVGLLRETGPGSDVRRVSAG